MKKRSIFTLLLLLVIFICASCNNTAYTISIDEMKNGVVTPSVTEAKGGETVTLDVAPGLGYKLVEGSLKANNQVVSDNEFKMPNSNVNISASFELDAEPLTVTKTNLSFSVTSNKRKGTANVTTNFLESGLKINIVVEDEKLLAYDSITNSDGIVILFSERSTTKGYVANITHRYEILANKTSSFKVYNGTSFEDKNVEINSELKYFSVDNELGGYVVDVTIPYDALGLTSQNVKDLLSICPVLYNQNSNSESIKANFASSKEHQCDLENQNTYLLITDDNTYEKNPYVNGSYQFNIGELDYCSQWDLSQDYFPHEEGYDDRKVVLSGTNEADNYLYFSRSQETELYLEATFLLTDVYNDETLGKFGFRFVDSFGCGFIFFIDAYGSNVKSMTSAREAGYILIEGNEYKWDTHTKLFSDYIPAQNETVKLAVYRNGGDFTLCVDDQVVATLHDPAYLEGQEEIQPVLFSFNLGIEVTEYNLYDNPEEFEDLVPQDKTQGFMFKNASDTLRNGGYWDLTNDKEGNSGPVYLTGHDRIDNNLFFNMSSTQFMYARATITVTDYINKGDAWIKFGLTLFDGADKATGNQYMFYADAFTGDKNYSSSLFHIVGDKYGRMLRQSGVIGSWIAYDGSPARFDLGSLSVTMEMVYEKNTIYFYADGQLVGVENYSPKTSNLFIGIQNFGFGLEVTNYYCTTNKNDYNIGDTVTQDSKALYYFLGSSVTYGSNTNGVSFVDILPDRLKCTVLKNAVSGTTLVEGNNSYIQRLKQMPINANVEHLVVQLSTNDATQNKPLGTLTADGTTSYDTNTIIGAIEEIISYAKKTWNCDVTFYTNPKYSSANYETMISALYQVQAKWNIGILDFYNYRDMVELSDQTLSSYMSDAIHPNSKGYAWMADEFAKYLRKLYETKHPGDTL